LRNPELARFRLYRERVRIGVRLAIREGLWQLPDDFDDDVRRFRAATNIVASDPLTLSTALDLLARAYAVQGLIDKAQAYLQKSLDVLERNSIPVYPAERERRLRTQAHIQLAKAHTHWAKGNVEAFRHDIEKMEITLQEAYREAWKHDLQHHSKKTCTSLSM
jgi:hypothetical protein